MLPCIRFLNIVLLTVTLWNYYLGSGLGCVTKASVFASRSSFQFPQDSKLLYLELSNVCCSKHPYRTSLLLSFVVTPLVSLLAFLVTLFPIQLIVLVSGSLWEQEQSLDSTLSCALYLEFSTSISSDRLKGRCLFVVSAYTLMDRTSPEAKDSFYLAFSRLLRVVLSAHVVVVACDFSAQLDCLWEAARHLRGPFAAPVDRTENTDILMRFCSDENCPHSRWVTIHAHLVIQLMFWCKRR